MSCEVTASGSRSGTVRAPRSSQCAAAWGVTTAAIPAVGSAVASHSANREAHVATTVFRTCPLCEAACGLAITLNGNGVESIRGDVDDVFSGGFICPKGTAVKHLDEDPDRLRAPLVRTGG